MKERTGNGYFPGNEKDKWNELTQAISVNGREGLVYLDWFIKTQKFLLF